ncbi:hypothetical protein BDN67DRAFT_115137 [Paxillus ammoniavirescens]|nr:hypothetical protein BDN67DRAFT_115137 [Paxillus ammoniavirescens]
MLTIHLGLYALSTFVFFSCSICSEFPPSFFFTSETRCLMPASRLFQPCLFSHFPLFCSPLHHLVSPTADISASTPFALIEHHLIYSAQSSLHPSHSLAIFTAYSHAHLHSFISTDSSPGCHSLVGLFGPISFWRTSPTHAADASNICCARTAETLMLLLHFFVD